MSCTVEVKKNVAVKNTISKAIGKGSATLAKVEAKIVFNAGDSISIFIEKQRLLSNFGQSYQALEKSAASYKHHLETFGFLNKLYSEFGNDTLRICTKNLVKIYNCDLKDEFVKEIIQFRYFFLSRMKNFLPIFHFQYHI